MNAGLAFASTVICVLVSAPSFGAACPVPSAQHATIQQAADDSACSTVVLSAGAFPESTRIRRSVGVAGAGSGSTAVEGRIEIVGNIAVALSGFSIANGCTESGLEVSGGASVSAQDVAVVTALLPCPDISYPIFDDGFES
jgi:hypothetical protein